MGATIRLVGGIGRQESNRRKTGIEPGKPIAARGGTDRLSDTKCRAAKPRTQAYKLADGKGMYLLVKPNGAKLWQLKFRLGGKEKTYSIGIFPEVGLAEAHIERDRARGWVRDGKNPTIERRIARASVSAQQAITFRAVAEEYLARQHFTAKHLANLRVLLNRDLCPELGTLPLAEIENTPALALEALRHVERRGTLETAAKCRRLGSQIFRYAVQTTRAKSDPFALLAGALSPPRTQHRATIALAEMPALFKALAAVPAEKSTKCAITWLLLTACRTGEMRFAVWGEIEADKLWRIPAERMKMRDPHVVPLSRQAQSLLCSARELRTSRDASALLFPGFTRHGALSENALLALIARSGFFGRQTAHGFRASFSTWAHEVAEADPDVIEACLAHVKEGVRGIYNRAAYLSKRRELLQAWADQLEAWGMRLP